jgi:hypothetical protein
VSDKTEKAIRRAIEGYEPSWAGGDNIAITLITEIEHTLDLSDDAEMCENDTWAQEAVNVYEKTMSDIVQRVIEELFA